MGEQEPCWVFFDVVASHLSITRDIEQRPEWTSDEREPA
jgi:hypothetical protein